MSARTVNASVTENQCLQRVTPTLTHVENLRYHYRATPVNWTITAWSSWATSTTKQNRFYQFVRKRF